MIKTIAQPIPVLLVDNDPDCRLLMRDALGEADVPSTVYECGSGEQALKFLTRQQEFADAPRPALIFLDVEMPGGIDGLETLRRIKAVREFRQIPVIMMTGVCGEDQMKLAAELGANSYTLKPADAERFLNVARTSANYWLSVHQFPQHHIPQEACRR